MGKLNWYKVAQEISEYPYERHLGMTKRQFVLRKNKALRLFEAYHNGTGGGDPAMDKVANFMNSLPTREELEGVYEHPIFAVSMRGWCSAVLRALAYEKFFQKNWINSYFGEREGSVFDIVNSIDWTPEEDPVANIEKALEIFELSSRIRGIIQTMRSWDVARLIEGDL